MFVGAIVKYLKPRKAEHASGLVVECISPTQSKVLFSDNVKLVINNTNLQIIEGKSAKTVKYGGMYYLVTPKQSIVSMTSHRIMEWPENHGLRKAILALV